MASSLVPRADLVLATLVVAWQKDRIQERQYRSGQATGLVRPLAETSFILRTTLPPLMMCSQANDDGLHQHQRQSRAAASWQQLEGVLNESGRRSLRVSTIHNLLLWISE